MTIATLTSKGQVTIPKKIRDSLKLNSGDKIDFIISNNMDVVIKPVHKKVDDLFGKLHNPNRKSISVVEMNNAIKNRMKNRSK